MNLSFPFQKFEAKILGKIFAKCFNKSIQMKTLLPAAFFFCGLFNAVNCASAQTWMPTSATNMRWGTIAASADGSKLAALSENGAAGAIWISTNGGINWTSNNIPGVPDTGRVDSVAMSASGNKLAAVALFANAIFTSTDYGTTWISNNVPSEPWFQVASSADGAKLVAVGGEIFAAGPIYVSQDSGTTWIQANAPVTNWSSVASSASGSNWVATIENTTGPFGGSIYTSTNCGYDWTLMTGAPDIPYLSVASSADGTKLIASGVEGIYTSTNSGVTWVSNAVPSEFWSGVACSANGQTLVAVAIYNLMGDAGCIFTSTNSGATWISNSISSQNWFGVASSADGGTLVATGNNSFGSSPGGIYISQTIAAPELIIAAVNTNLAVSWLIPSTNFVLQQSSDLISWSNITNTPELNLTNLNNELCLLPTNNSGFFRLIPQ